MYKPLDKFLSCDWGTSSFRLRLIGYENLDVIVEEKNNNGIAKTFKLWQENGANEHLRQSFYYAVINEYVEKISKQLGFSLAGIPIIVSGMLSSSIGMVDLPYKAIPVAIDGSDVALTRLTIDRSDNELIIISGIRTNDDVIRGEETKAIGCASFFDDEREERLIVFPGTHPKHVTIEKNNIIGIKTYMTGEIFGLLTTHSLLAGSIQKGFFDEDGQASFKSGVRNSLNTNLLNSVFRVRTNDILKKLPKEYNYYYLSGLLIGTELKDLLDYKQPFYLCGAGELLQYYQLAGEILGLIITQQIDADEALLRGQKQVYAMLNYPTL